VIGPSWRHGLTLPGLAVQALNSARGLQLRLNWSKGVVDLGDVDAAIAKLRQSPRRRCGCSSCITRWWR
jgi:hypothetical protein